MKKIPRRIENNFNGVAALLKIYDELMMESKIDSVIFDFSDNNWFEANLVTILATAFEGLIRKNSEISIYIN